MTFLTDAHARQLAVLAAGFLRDTGSLFEGAVLVEPTQEFFPDAVTPSAEAVELLFQRVCSYTPLPEDAPYEFAFVEPEAAGGGACGTGACATPGESDLVTVAVRQGATFVLPVNVQCAGKAEGLMSTLCRHSGSLVYALADTQPAPVGLGESSEVLASLSGLGLLLLIGSHVYCKGCSTVRFDRYTALAPEELAWLCALFLELHQIPAGKARKHLSGTTRELFDEATRWFEARPALCEAFRTRPASIAEGQGDFSQRPRGFFSKLWGAA